MLLGSVPTSQCLKQYLQCLKKGKPSSKQSWAGVLLLQNNFSCGINSLWEGGLIAGGTKGWSWQHYFVFQTPNLDYWGGLLSTEESGSEIDFLERAHQSSMKAIKGLQPKESLGQLGPLALKRLRGIASMGINVWQEGANKTEVDQWNSQHDPEVLWFLLWDFLPPPTPCIFCLPLADYFAARHGAVATLNDVPVVSDKFWVPHKVTWAWLYNTEIPINHTESSLMGVMLKYPSTSVASFCCSFPILCLLKWKINRALDILLRHHKLCTASFSVW